MDSIYYKKYLKYKSKYIQLQNHLGGGVVSDLQNLISEQLQPLIPNKPEDTDKDRILKKMIASIKGLSMSLTNIDLKDKKIDEAKNKIKLQITEINKQIEYINLNHELKLSGINESILDNRIEELNKATQSQNKAKERVQSNKPITNNVPITINDQLETIIKNLNEISNKNETINNLIKLVTSLKNKINDTQNIKLIEQHEINLINSLIFLVNMGQNKNIIEINNNLINEYNTKNAAIQKSVKTASSRSSKPATTTINQNKNIMECNNLKDINMKLELEFINSNDGKNLKDKLNELFNNLKNVNEQENIKSIQEQINKLKNEYNIEHKKYNTLYKIDDQILTNRNKMAELKC